VKRINGVALLIFLLLATASRLPAPISEVESPTPTPTVAAAAKSKKSKKKPKTVPEVSPKSGTAAPVSVVKHKRGIYAGTWRGMIRCNMYEDIEHEIIINDAQTSMTVRKIGSGNGGCNGTGVPSIGSEGITVQLPGLNGKWVLKPGPDGKTARVRLTSFLRDSSAIFVREQ
jgi:hypothetical protein